MEAPYVEPSQSIVGPETKKTYISCYEVMRDVFDKADGIYLGWIEEIAEIFYEGIVWYEPDIIVIKWYMEGV
jgi:hypothetical protein